jgi:predicted DNA-binding protein
MQTATTTIRIDRDVHRRLLALSRESGRQLMDVVSDAADALERVQFANHVTDELEKLRNNPTGWSAYLGDAELAVDDGVAR